MSARFDTVLVANRGEIARRIIRSARENSLRSVAVFSDADRAAPHVREADERIHIGPAPARDSYLSIKLILAAAVSTGAGAIHPGYGFLSENFEFAQAVEDAGLAFIGPTPQHIASFGAKHTARTLAAGAGVPMLAGTGLLANEHEAVAEALRVGLPVMVKASGGGGGIGMQACATVEEVRDAYLRVARLAEANFGSAGVFLERLVRPARHVEVQLFGDGEGRVAVFGDRDCSLQRRNQKVLEEAPAPALPDHVRELMHYSARKLAESVNYRSVGTVEFVYDPVREEASFLEVNARLQVEHPVTEEVYGVDLVALMLSLARDGADSLDPALFDEPKVASGHAIEARVYAEDPAKNGLPSSGLVTQVRFPGQGTDAMDGVRIDGWIETGLEVSPYYDPMLAKVIALAPTRDAALDLLAESLDMSRIDGIVTNLSLLRSLTDDLSLRTATHSTSTLDVMKDPLARIDIITGGLQTTVQDLPGRIGYWQVGVPPSGPFDPVSLQEANLAVGNPFGAPALEITASGPTLRFSAAAVIAVTGAPVTVTIDGEPSRMWEPIEIEPGQVVVVGAAPGPGLRSYLAVRGGIDVPKYLGSASTFTLGGFGGHAGRAIREGDVLRLGSPDSHADHPAFAAGSRLTRIPGPTPAHRRPALTSTWQVGVTEGPHAAPDFFTREDLEVFYSTEFRVHHNSARTGIRLIGPRPGWAREDGGEAGLHPSNIHDTAYAVGAIDFTGDTPIILGPDGPSLGGFVCPAVVASGDLWKLGQLRPGDTVRFIRVREADAAALVDQRASLTLITSGSGDGDDGVLARLEPTNARPSVTYRRDGDDNVLVEYGDMTLDIGLRMRVHALHERLAEFGPKRGIIDVTPGIRSLQVHTDSSILKASSMAALLRELEDDIPPTTELVVPSRTVRLPLSWDDPATRLAIERYMAGVRDDAPWTPWNIEFIRRINGLDSVDAVYRTVFDASYLVLGLGDVYLGAPVATPLDPRHRLVTTKYNPARTWTAENSVGIGGAYLCIYGMEGPGGYQFVGRTVPIWNRFRAGGLFAENPWALRFFDRIEWYPVGADELMELRAETDAGRGEFESIDGEFSIAAYDSFLAENAASIAAFRELQTQAFTEEKDRWRESGEFDIRDESPTAVIDAVVLPEHATAVTAPFLSTLWQINVELGAVVEAGDRILAVEAMKMESVVEAPVSGRVLGIYAKVGDQVSPGQVLLAIGARA